MEVYYYQTSSGRSPVEDFIRDLSEVAQEQFFEAVQKLEDGRVLVGAINKNLSSIHKGLHELRLKDKSGIYRVFYFMKARKGIYMLHAFKKKTQKTPPKEIKIAVNRLKEIR